MDKKLISRKKCVKVVEKSKKNVDCMQLKNEQSLKKLWINCGYCGKKLCISDFRGFITTIYPQDANVILSIC